MDREVLLSICLSSIWRVFHPCPRCYDEHVIHGYPEARWKLSEFQDPNHLAGHAAPVILFGDFLWHPSVHTPSDGLMACPWWRAPILLGEKRSHILAGVRHPICWYLKVGPHKRQDTILRVQVFEVHQAFDLLGRSAAG